MIDKYGAVDGMKIDRGNSSTLKKTAPVPLSPPQISHYLTWDRTLAAAAGSRLTTFMLRGASVLDGFFAMTKYSAEWIQVAEDTDHCRDAMSMVPKKLRKISGSRSGCYDEICLLGYNEALSVENHQIFRKDISPPSSGSKNKANKKPK
jgi:hypothetical protein